MKKKNVETVEKINTQIVVDKKSKQVLCTTFSKGKCHDFRIFKESKMLIYPTIKVITDSGYQEIQKIHIYSQYPKKKSKKKLLTKEDRENNRIKK